MVELQHCQSAPQELQDFCAQHPTASAQDWNSKAFASAKRATKAALNQEQGGLCVYCESRLNPEEGQIDHIQPKAQQPGLCFSYTNLAHSCINAKTCGQAKKEGVLPIIPAPDCNRLWTLSTDGTIEPVLNLSRRQRHEVLQTRDMLGLNRDPELVDERRRTLANMLLVLQYEPEQLAEFLRSEPYRWIMGTVL